MTFKFAITAALVLVITGCSSYKPAPEPKGEPFPINKPIVTHSEI